MTQLRAAIGLGSNVGDREAIMRAAVEALSRAPGVTIVSTSSVYETPPWGYAEQAPFLNAVVVVKTSLGSLQLLILLKTLEAKLGRTKTFRWGPREIDLDLLLHEGVRTCRRGLTVPHLGLLERAFALIPLAEVWPDAPLPDGVTFTAALARLATDREAMRAVGQLTVPSVR
jgi:2-amino-4-hydroxy-6-hydroxymethyldihydropteridine diphosphokinase